MMEFTPSLSEADLRTILVAFIIAPAIILGFILGFILWFVALLYMFVRYMDRIDKTGADRPGKRVFVIPLLYVWLSASFVLFLAVKGQP